MPHKRSKKINDLKTIVLLKSTLVQYEFFSYSSYWLKLPERKKNTVVHYHNDPTFNV